jgi:hypothetical protein
MGKLKHELLVHLHQFVLQLFLAGIMGRGRWSVIVDIAEEVGLIYRSGFCSVEKIIRIELI